MVRTELELARSEPAERSATLAYLESRVREEADAAGRAASLEATLVHVALATRYAERFRQCSDRNAAFNGEVWLEEHRLW